MYENTPPPFLPPPARSPGLGCFAKGCLVVIVVGVLLMVMGGGVMWYVGHSLMPFYSQQAPSIRVFPATEEQFRAVQQKVAPFIQTINAGHAATVALTADDINILIAHDTRPSSLRGKAYLSIEHNQLAADVGYPISDTHSGRAQGYVVGHVVFDASFANGDFTLVIRQIEPLEGGKTPGMISAMIGSKGFSDGLSRGFNQSFRETINKNAAASEFLDRLQTVIVKDNEIVITALEGPPTVAAPANTQ